MGLIWRSKKIIKFGGDLILRSEKKKLNLVRI